MPGLKVVFTAIFAILVSPILAIGQDIGLAEADNPLLEAQWTYRLVVVCGAETKPSEPTLLDQQYAQASWDWPGYIDRDMILVWISPEDIMTWHPKPNAVKAATLMIGLAETDDTHLRQRTACTADNDFVALIGKDGEVKARSDRAMPNQDLFALIDAMPMRQQELQSAPPEELTE
ncbi:MAG: DUF4174 domain-containing protein [Pseudomonadota bacterium]